MPLYRSIEASMKRLRKIVSLDEETAGGPRLKDKSLPSILLDIANYEDADLVQYSLLLLDQYYSSESSIFIKALESRLLETEKSISLHKDISKGEHKKIDGLELKPIEKLAQKCWLEGEVKGYEPHQINQNIILSFGN